MVHLYYEWNWVAAEAAFKRALELNPDDGTTRMRYALALPYFGRFDDALREIARAREADPLSPVFSANVGKILHLARKNTAKRSCWTRTSAWRTTILD
jgi:Flp pilus assembly protein TadD